MRWRDPADAGKGPSAIPDRSCSSLIVIYPIFFVIQTSFKTDAEILANFWGLPKGPDACELQDAWVKASIGTYFMNSSIVVVTSTVAIIYVAILAAYALARLQVKRRTSSSGYCSLPCSFRAR